MWSRRLIAGLALALFASGCTSFRPLHGSSSGTALNAEIASIEIPERQSRSLRTLRNALIERLHPEGQSPTPRYRLDVNLNRTRRSLAVQLDDRITRFDMVVTVTANLVELDTNKSDYRTRVTRVASYNVFGEPFATLVAERDAERRATTEIADQLRLLLSLHFEQKANMPVGQGQS